MVFENQGDLEQLDDQGGDNTPIRDCGKVGWANIEMGPLSLTIRSDYWWNASHSEYQGNLRFVDRGGKDASAQTW